MYLYQLAKRLKPYDVELERTRAAVIGPTGEHKRFYYFVRGDNIVPTATCKEDAFLTHAEVDRFLRLLDLENVPL